MGLLSPTVLLHAWESGLAQGDAFQRADVLLALARPGLDAQARGQLAMGARDRALLALHTTLFGPMIEARTDCPACGEALELGFDAGALLDGVDPAAAPAAPGELQLGDWQLRFRLPGASDLEAVARLPATAEVRRDALLSRLLLDSRCQGAACSLAELPAALRAAFEDALERSDVAALPEFELACEACAHRWTPLFDVAEFLWHRLDAWAGRLLWEVHALARAYAWSEDVLINMSPWRRQRYLEMLSA
ncbi:MAG: hypothetical protein KGI67_09060 [Pseudomonadota bacterium]|nr:hypothetical protein [Pseudomonadota bacterium]